MAALKPKIGRPLKFKSAEELQEKIEEYFAMCKEEKRPYTITGLALALDTNRETLLDYGKNKGELFSYTIMRAKEIIHNYAEESLWAPKVTQGVVFNLKNNWDWRDKREVEHSGSVGIGDVLDEMENPQEEEEE